jgi:hypothetical protein
MACKFHMCNFGNTLIILANKEMAEMLADCILEKTPEDRSDVENAFLKKMGTQFHFMGIDKSTYLGEDQ